MEQYIQRALAGDELAIRQITEQHKPRLLAKAYAYSKNKQDAEDIVQETFIKAFEALPQLKEAKYFATWLYKIMIRESIKMMKKQQHTKQLEVEIMANLQLLDQEKSEDYSKLHHAVASLKRDYQIAITLHYFYDFKVFEIAEILAKPHNTIKMHLHRGRKALRVKLEETMQQPLQQKDVKQMLKEHLLYLAQQYSNPPVHYELELEDYQEGGIASFMWQGQDSDESVFIRLDDNGRLDDFAKTPTKKGPMISEDRKLEIAKKLLLEQYPEAFSYYKILEQNKKESSTRFTFGQVVDDFPLENYYCQIEVTDPGEVIMFTYTGYMENPPQIPEKLYPPERILTTLYEGDWSLHARSFHQDDEVETKAAIHAIYESALLSQTYDAVTGKALIEKNEEPKPCYIPFPKVDALPKKATFEEIFGISKDWERFEETNGNDAYEVFDWRLKDSPEYKGKSYEHYMKNNFENRIKVKVNKYTKRVTSYIHFTADEGDVRFSEEQCFQLAAQFIQTYYPEFTPYLQVEKKDEEDIEESQSSFRFVLQKEGLIVKNGYFQFNMSKQTGNILMFVAPNITLEAIESFKPQAIKPIEELLPVEGLEIQKGWQMVYGNLEQNEEGMRFVYRIQTKDGSSVEGIDAESGEIMI